MSRLFLGLGITFLMTAPASAQFRYMPGVRPVPTFSPMQYRPMYPVMPSYYNYNYGYRPGIIGMPNPLSNPYFAAEYYQMRYGYNPYFFGSGYTPYVNPYPVIVPTPAPIRTPAPPSTPVPSPAPSPFPTTTPIASVGGPSLFSPATNAGSLFSWFPHQIHVFVPVADAKITVNGVSLNGTGTDRKLTVDAVKPGSRHEYTIVATWTQDGKPVSRNREVTLDGTGHGVADFR